MIIIDAILLNQLIERRVHLHPKLLVYQLLIPRLGSYKLQWIKIKNFKSKKHLIYFILKFLEDIITFAHQAAMRINYIKLYILHLYN